MFSIVVQDGHDHTTLLTYVQAVGPIIVSLVVGVFGIWLARSQLATARNKLKLELFDKRLEVYYAVQEHIGFVLNNGFIKPEKERDFVVQMRLARFCFDRCFADALMLQVTSNVYSLQNLLIEKDKHGEGPGRDEIEAKIEREALALRNWFEMGLPELFDAWLHLDH